MTRTFIAETTHQRRQRLYTLAVLGVLCLILAASLWAGGGALSEVGLLVDDSLSFLNSDAPLTTSQLFVTGFVGGLFFIPLPLEIITYMSIVRGSPPLESALAVVIGFLLSNIFNYVVGWRLSGFVKTLISTKKMYAMRRKVNRYGSYAVFGINVILAPAPLLTLALGIVRYNLTRLFVLMAVANVVKFSVVIGLAYVLA